MFRKPGQAPMRARSIQCRFFGSLTRVFLMEARMLGLPVGALHVYRYEEATFTVRIASAITMVELTGLQISAAETVTMLNDLCLMAPGALPDPRLTWTGIDDGTTQVTMANGPHEVTAALAFNDDAELVDFASDDRPEGPFMYGDFTVQSIEYDLAAP